MRLGCKVLFVLQLALTIQVYGQQTLNGRVYESLTDSIITGVNVFNINTKASTRTGIDGSFKISASEGDMVIFSASGFKPDTITVSFSLMLTRFDLNLHRDVISLKTVNVTSSYSADSINRRQEYSKIYEQPGITGRNRPANGFGITLSPASFFRASRHKQGFYENGLKKKRRKDISTILFQCHGSKQLHDWRVTLYHFSCIVTAPPMIFAGKVARNKCSFISMTS